MVKVVDKAGNERIEILTPQRMIIYEDVFLFFGYLIILVALIIFVIKFRNVHANKRSTNRNER